MQPKLRIIALGKAFEEMTFQASKGEILEWGIYHVALLMMSTDEKALFKVKDHFYYKRKCYIKKKRNH